MRLIPNFRRVKAIQVLTPPLQIASIILEGGQLYAMRLVDEVFPTAIEFSARDQYYIERDFYIDPVRFRAILLFSSYHSLLELKKEKESRNILFKEVIFTVNDQDAELQSFNVNPDPTQVHEISFIGCVGEQPFVKVSADNRSETLIIDFRGLDDFKGDEDPD